MVAGEQSTFKGFYAVTLIALLAICLVIGVYAAVYWSATQNIQQTITYGGKGTAVTPVTVTSPVEAGATGAYTETGALTVDIQKTGGLYINWAKGSTTPASLTDVYSTLTLDVKEGTTTLITIDLLAAGPWKTSSTISGSYTYDYVITYTVKPTIGQDYAVVVPLTVTLTDV